MLILFRGDSRSQAPPPPEIEKPEPGAPDFANLVEILIELAPPDAAGEITLDTEEASRIREAGWSARAGVWRVPLIPWRFISPYPLLWILDDQIDPASRSLPWRAKRSAFIRPAEISHDELSRRECQILGLLQRNGRLSRTQLQRRVSYLISTPILDFLLERLLAQQFIAIEDGWIVQTHRSPLYGRQPYERQLR